jgi:hypothetical protein
VGLANVRRQEQQRGAQNEQDIQKVIEAGGQPIGGGKYAISGGPGPRGGDANFYDDPIINALVNLPSEQEANRYTGANPSFHGVQRPGDWQRHVQLSMAADRLPGGGRQLADLQGIEREKAKQRSMTTPGYGLT